MATLEPVTPGLQKLEIGELLSLGKGEDWEKGNQAVASGSEPTGRVGSTEETGPARKQAW